MTKNLLNLKTSLFISILATVSSSFAQADSCTLLSGGRELLSSRKTIQVGNVFYNLTLTVPDLISEPGTCVSTPATGIIDPVISMANMGTNTFTLPADSRAQLVVSQWEGSDLRQLARVSYSKIAVSRVLFSLLIVPIEDAFYDFSDPTIEGDFSSLPKEITSFYEVNFRFFLASGPANFVFHEPDPNDSGNDLNLQSDEDRFQDTPTDDSGTAPQPNP
jgi:hypothetical protein